jgi:hypothetical protein
MENVSLGLFRPLSKKIWRTSLDSVPNIHG